MSYSSSERSVLGADRKQNATDIHGEEVLGKVVSRMHIFSFLKNEWRTIYVTP